jgi:hypothetical protein
LQREESGEWRAQKGKAKEERKKIGKNEKKGKNKRYILGMGTEKKWFF